MFHVFTKPHPHPLNFYSGGKSEISDLPPTNYTPYGKTFYTRSLGRLGKDQPLSRSLILSSAPIQALGIKKLQASNYSI